MSKTEPIEDMRATTGMKLLALGLAIAYVIGCILAPSIGRTSPRAASWLRPLSFAFQHSYDDGKVLGFAIGQPKAQAWRDMRAAGFEIEPVCWGDNRAGGASLYSLAELERKAAAADAWCIRRGGEAMDLDFSGDRLVRATVSFVSIDIVM